MSEVIDTFSSKKNACEIDEKKLVKNVLLRNGFYILRCKKCMPCLSSEYQNACQFFFASNLILHGKLRVKFYFVCYFCTPYGSAEVY